MDDDNRRRCAEQLHELAKLAKRTALLYRHRSWLMAAIAKSIEADEAIEASRLLTLLPGMTATDDAAHATLKDGNRVLRELLRLARER